MSPGAKRILLVAPVPTHPTVTGAGARVRYMAEALQALGHEVHFLHLQQALFDRGTALGRYWNDRLHVFHSLSPASLIGRGRRKLWRVTGNAFDLDLPVDCYFDAGSARYLRRLLQREAFDVVILSYVFYSRLLEFLPPNVLRLIDTHDVFSERFRLYREHGQVREFFSTSRAGERKALDRADLVLAIQHRDAAHFRSLTRRPVAVVGHLAAPVAAAPAVSNGGPPGVLFVGGPMGINVHGVRWFMERVLPLVRREVPYAELWLVGGICDRLGREAPGVRGFGFVDPLDELYRSATVVINPQQFGTGLSIKTVDALRYGRPAVTTPSGGRGLEEGAGVAFLQAESAEAFAGCLVELLRDPARRDALARSASAFAGDYYRRNLRALQEAVHVAPGR